MTGRSVPEWIGKNADSAIPPRIRVRVFEAHGGRCAGCTRKIGPADKWDCDHIQALANGGQNRERNLQPLCSWCHGDKTKADVAEKAVTYRKKAKHIGVKKRAGNSLSHPKYKRKMDGTVVLRVPLQEE